MHIEGAPQTPGERLLWRLLALVAAAAMASLLAHVLLRIGYRYDLEWMEGAMVDHAARAQSGIGIYTAPSAEHVPFLYTPMLFWLGALVAQITGSGPVALRLVSFGAFVACAWIMARWTRRETASRMAGLVAAGLLCAGYGFLRSWYDLARNDTLFLLWAGATATFAFLSKQSALLWLPALGLGLLLVDWRRALLFALSTAVILGSTVLTLHLSTDGWFTFYVFEMPRHHGWQGEYKLRFFTSDLLPLLPIVLLSLVACAQRFRADPGEAALLAAFAGGATLTSYLSRLHVGGYDNVVMPAFAACCMLAPIASAQARKGTRARWLALLCLQFALLTIDVRAAWEQGRNWVQGFGSQFLPSQANARANDEFLAALAAIEGPVFVPFHGNAAAMAGKPRVAHAQAIHDLLQALPHGANGQPDLAAFADAGRLADLSPRTREALTSFYGSVHDAIRTKQFGALVLDQPIGPVFEALFAPSIAGNYERRPGEVLSAPTAFQPTVGMVTHSPYVLVPAKK
jgi:hypothetical protein